jgi:hypothetical protein
MANFWTEASVEPKRNFRWLVRMGDNEVVWWAKTVTTPAYEVSEVEHNFLDNKYYYPGRVSWNEVTLTLVDPISPDATAKTLKLITEAGYKVKTSNDLGNNGMSMISKSKAAGGQNKSKGIGQFRIEVYNANGKLLERWGLHNAFIKSAKYGDLDYSNDELRTVEMTLRYDWADCEIGQGSPEAGKNFEPKGTGTQGVGAGGAEAGAGGTGAGGAAGDVTG